MRRSLLATMTVLGALICLVGSTGLFAALSDSAMTGTNTVTSDDLPHAVDIKLASVANIINDVACGTFSDDLDTPLITQSDLTPGNVTLAYVCLSNAGAQAATDVSVISTDLNDLDQACTGDEAASGDVTCGAASEGELSSVLSVAFSSIDCGNAEEIEGTPEVNLADSATTPLALPAIGAGETVCLKIQVSYRVPADPLAAQVAQSDTATWRFRFTAGL